jgi:hypothetical protein
VAVIAPSDPRMLYSLGVMGAALVLVALGAFINHSGPRKKKKSSSGRAGAKPDFDSLVIPMASDDEHPTTA